jgi:hypothetical protein
MKMWMAGFSDAPSKAKRHHSTGKGAMRKLSLAIMFLGASGIITAAIAPASAATTCSGRYRTCLRVCPHGERCRPGCTEVFSNCVRSGCWDSMIEHACGYIKR